MITSGTVNNKYVELKEIPKIVAKDMMMNNHYSKKWNLGFGKINIGLFYESELVGGLSFGQLMNPKSGANMIEGCGMNNIIELNRMWIDDVLGKNTESWAIAKSIKFIKEKYPEIWAIQSFADGRLGCGTIYKASNFKYFGCSESIFWVNSKTGEVTHNVAVTDANRPNSLIQKNFDILKGRLFPYKVKSYKYMYFLKKKNKLNKVLIKEQPYPEYNKGMKEIPLDDGWKVKIAIRLKHVIQTVISERNIPNGCKKLNLYEVMGLCDEFIERKEID